MAFLLRHSIFIHTPKTAGQWVASALENAGLVVGNLGVIHASPDEIKDEPAFKKRPGIFTMVRHPLTWYRSMWAHRMDEKWTPIDDPDWFTPRWVEAWEEFTKYCMANRFDDFVRKCTTHFSNGFVSGLYDVYTRDCTFVGKQERLVKDLLTVLKIAGEQFQPEQISKTPPRNVRAHLPHRLNNSMYTSELIDLVMKTEQSSIDRFSYHKIPQEILSTI